MKKKTKAWAVIVKSNRNLIEAYQVRDDAYGARNIHRQTFPDFPLLVVPCEIFYSIPSKGKKK